jgi:hypothetical protein
LSQLWIKDYVTVEVSVIFYVHHPAGKNILFSLFSYKFTSLNKMS